MKLRFKDQEVSDAYCILCFLISIIIAYSIFIYIRVDNRIVDDSLLPLSTPIGYVEYISFESRDQYDFIYSSFTNRPIIHSELYLPNKLKVHKGPLMIALHGSQGFMDYHEYYLRKLLEDGVAVLKIYSFISRGVSKTVGGQNSVTMQMMIADIFFSVKHLKEQTRHEFSKVGVFGFSLGGGAAIYSGWNPNHWKTIWPQINDIKLDLHIGFYPPCFIYPTKEVNLWTDKRMEILIGDQDVWTPAYACNKLVGMATESTRNIYLSVYSNAHHAFDTNIPLQLLPNAYSFENCSFHITKNMKTIDENGIIFGNAKNRTMAFAKCARKGVTYVGTKDMQQRNQVRKKFFRLVQQNLII